MIDPFESFYAKKFDGHYYVKNHHDVSGRLQYSSFPILQFVVNGGRFEHEITPKDLLKGRLDEIVQSINEKSSETRIKGNLSERLMHIILEEFTERISDFGFRFNLVSGKHRRVFSENARFDLVFYGDYALRCYAKVDNANFLLSEIDGLMTYKSSKIRGICVCEAKTDQSFNFDADEIFARVFAPIKSLLPKYESLTYLLMAPKEILFSNFDERRLKKKFGKFSQRMEELGVNVAYMRYDLSLNELKDASRVINKQLTLNTFPTLRVSGLSATVSGNEILIHNGSLIKRLIKVEEGVWYEE